MVGYTVGAMQQVTAQVMTADTFVVGSGRRWAVMAQCLPLQQLRFYLIDGTMAASRPWVKLNSRPDLFGKTKLVSLQSLLYYCLMTVKRLSSLSTALRAADESGAGFQVSLRNSRSSDCYSQLESVWLL